MRVLSVSICIILGVGLFHSCGIPGRNDTGPRRIEILFLGHASEHHNSAKYLPMLASVLSKEGINFTYSDDPDVLNPETLSKYDGLMLYANHDKITPTQEDALLNFVEQGKGFIPVHCASYCFRNSERYVHLVGGQFQKHEVGEFIVPIVNKEHPAVQSVQEFSTWDETYVHDKLSDDRTVLMERVEGEHREPWTWVKEHGKGRVFYTAYGHDERTWNNPGFHQLIKEGILWAVNDRVKKQWEEFRKGMPQLVYRDEENIPNYEKRDPAPKYQEPLSPEESKKLIQIPAGFNLELFAAEPDIINPIAIEWDEQGRLWVIETVDYPNTVDEREGKGGDRIKICEDTDGDGKADKFTLFADKLNIPTSLTFYNGGVIVSQAPYFLFLKDTDGDGKADVRKILVEGWGTYDTHAGPSNLRYGFDNQIWGVVGYSGFNGLLAGENRKFGQGVYRFKPDLSSFEFLSPTSNNTWGLGFTENNDVFASTANNTHSVFVAIPTKSLKGVEGLQTNGNLKIDGHYAMHPVTPNVRQVDVFGGFTAAAGHSFYTARAYPKEFWNTVAFVCEPTGHLVHMAQIERKGAGFTEKDGWNLFASADEWVSPVEAKVGPDGVVWIADWYNFIIQHNPTPTPDRGGYQAKTGKGNAYENPLRDKSRGRIWRVVPEGAKRYKPIRLSKDDPKELIKTLANDNMFWRLTAQRLLVERENRDVLPQLYELVKDQKLDEFGNNYAATHALWVIDGLGALSKDDNAEKIVTDAMKHPAAGVRKAAIQILSKARWTEEVVLQSNILNDTDPNTQLTAILSLVEIAPSDALGKTLYKLSLDEKVKNDNWLSQAVYVAANQHRQGFIAAYIEENPDYKNKQPKLVERQVMGYDDTAWKTMALPQLIESAGLNIDGVIWFRKTIDIPNDAARQKATLSLGPIDDSDETWINGVRVGGIQKRYNEKRVYTIPAGILKSGKNTIAVRVEDTGGGGGIYGKAEDMFVQTGNRKIAIAGDWKYEVEKEYNSKNQNLFKDASIAETFIANYLNKPDQKESNDLQGGGDATIIQINVVKNQMKFDVKSFQVEAGKPVEIIFENPDFMQHNLVITQPGTLEAVGKAADKLASDPKGADKQYVPEMPEVLFATKLVDPQQTVRLKFIAPKTPGDYPFVCTFPGHWSIMNGTMKVVEGKVMEAKK